MGEGDARTEMGSDGKDKIKPARTCRGDHDGGKAISYAMDGKILS